MNRRQGTAEGVRSTALPIPPSAHITARRSRVPGCERRTKHRAEECRRVLLLRQPFALGIKKKKKNHFPDRSQTQLPDREPSPAEPGTSPSLSHSSLPSRLQSSQSFSQSPAAPPPVTLGGGAWHRAGSPAPGRCWMGLPVSPARITPPP